MSPTTTARGPSSAFKCRHDFICDVLARAFSDAFTAPHTAFFDILMSDAAALVYLLSDSLYRRRLTPTFSVT